MKIKLFLLFIFIFFCQVNAYSAQVHLKNEDRITGEIIVQNKKNVTIKTETMGTVIINKDFIERIVKAEGKTPEINKELKEVIWDREVSVGYNKATGNTRDSQLAINFFANKKREHIDEFTLKGDFYYSSSGKKMDAQKYYGMVRYAFSFGRNKAWYNFYRLEADHDRFANIYYRIVPATGVGYWFYDLPGIKIMTEVGIGLEHTDYNNQTKDRNEAILAPRAFIEKTLFDNLKISQDLYFYPVLDNFNQYRLHSDTALTIAMNKKLSLRLSLIDDYNSDPPKDTKKNDLRLISSLAYSF